MHAKSTTLNLVCISVVSASFPTWSVHRAVCAATIPIHSIALKYVRFIVSPFLLLTSCMLSQAWDKEGSRFCSATLKSLGAFIQLNHSGYHCDNPVLAHKSMLILHTNGIHKVDVRYCMCAAAIPQHIQLLCQRVYPASQINIRTCVTFELLRLLHMLALTTKSSTYNFYRALKKMTSNTGLDTPKSRYRALLQMVLQWCHLKMLKRSGRGNEPTGAMGMSTGELSIMCPSCPRPNINLEDGWESAPLVLK